MVIRLLRSFTSGVSVIGSYLIIRVFLGNPVIDWTTLMGAALGTAVTVFIMCK